MDDGTRWPKWIGWIAAAMLSGSLWAILWLMWRTIQKIF